MGLKPYAVIALARQEVGYCEKKNGDLKYLYDKSANSGSANYTKYGYEMHKIYPAVMDYPAYWCDCFVDWLFYKAYGISNAKKLLAGDFNDYTVASAQLYKNKNAWKKTPEVGDQVFFWNPSTKKIHHTGLVIEVKNTRFTVIEGNTSNGTAVVPNGGMVCEKSYPIGDDRIAGFGRPGWDKQPDFTPHWVNSNGIWYWRVGEHENYHGWKVINGHWYYFDTDGKMLTGRQEINEKIYFLEESGAYEGSCWKTDNDGAGYRWEVKE